MKKENPVKLEVPKITMCVYRLKRITENFCVNCKHKSTAADCSNFNYGDGVCQSFDWVTSAKKAEFEEGVLHSQAVTRWISLHNKELEEIYAMPKKVLLSVLTKAQLSQFNVPTLHKRAVACPTDELVAKENNTKCTVDSVAVVLPCTQPQKTQCYDLLGNPIYKKEKSMLTPKSPFPQVPSMSKPVAKAPEVKVVPEATKPVPTEPAVAKPVVAPVIPAEAPVEQKPEGIHVFTCKKPDGKIAVYKRDCSKASYQTEVLALRKDCVKRGIEILSETFEVAVSAPIPESEPTLEPVAPELIAVPEPVASKPAVEVPVWTPPEDDAIPEVAQEIVAPECQGCENCTCEDKPVEVNSWAPPEEDTPVCAPETVEDIPVEIVPIEEAPPATLADLVETSMSEAPKKPTAFGAMVPPAPVSPIIACPGCGVERVIEDGDVGLCAACKSNHLGAEEY